VGELVAHAITRVSASGALERVLEGGHDVVLRVV
jgi:hypothetical protein